MPLSMAIPRNLRQRDLDTLNFDIRMSSPYARATSFRIFGHFNKWLIYYEVSPIKYVPHN
ncbi:unnamed protein product [Ceratitis capitata]|uniref:(Mediterranean fruit fly) hypothetical protein n=1 Tax=Ceratitis capitata TaxID=7213 RepID=A0A811VF22_CERCA|nr:unnamed protein product [Ceratitis capitata]